MESFGESLARSLGALGPAGGTVGTVGPIEPPERVRTRRPGTARARWMALGAFAIVGATGILVVSGVGEGPLADLRSAWRADRPDAALPKPNSDGAMWARETVFSVPVDHLPTIGTSDAKVTLVVVTDYACIGCERARPMLESMRASYGADLRIVYKPRAEPTAVASSIGACAAALQGEFTRYDEAMWLAGIAKSRSLGVPIALPDAENPGCARDVGGCREVTRVARDVGLDLVRFASGMKRCDAIVRASARELDKLGVESPAFFVNGRMVDPWGIETIGTFQTLIDDELATARRRIAAGTAADRYYQQWVLDAGQLTR